jgi:regulator of sigma E protease
MPDPIFHLLVFILALGVLITVHEFGHYWVAKKLGVKVLRFSIGFGRPLWMKRVGPDQMELVVAWLPLGGYVKMLDEHEAPVAPEERARAFNRQRLWKRAAIVAAGPLANFLFALLAYWFVFLVGVEGLKPVVGKVLPDSIAAEAGFEPGDEILRIDGRPVASWDQRRLYLFRKALDREPVEVLVRSADGIERVRVLDLSQLPARAVDSALIERGLGLFPRLPEALPVVGAIESGSAAARAGLVPGDRITAVDGESVDSWAELVERVRASPGQRLRLTIERAGQRQELDIVPDRLEQDGRAHGYIGVRPRLSELPPEMRVTVRLGPLAALAEGVASTWSMSVLTVEMLWRMLMLEVSTENLSGPITIAQYAAYSAKVGFIPFVMFLAVISVSLGVLNLLPIPVLDGGHLLYYGIEAARGGRPLSPRAMAFGQRIGIAILAGLMVLAFYNDLVRLFG